ncbi:MAG: methanogenesis marker 12 protein [Candidatus Hydrothermarchaeaceae archaeon]
MSVLGIDHGTEGVRFCVLPENVLFELDRTAALHVSTLKEIEDHFPIEDIELVGLAYSMGDGISKITNIKKVENRGVLQEKTGRYVGGGTRVYDEIAGSGLDAVVIPGLHRNVEVIDPRFRALYSHMGAADKVSLSYHSYLRVNEDLDASNIIICDISSNTVTIAIKGGRFFGAIDACLGAVGLSHGPLDLETIRRIDAGEVTANEAFYSSGAAKIAKTENPKEMLDADEGDAKLAREALVLSARMEIVSFLGEMKPDAFVITGSAGVHENVFGPLKESLEGTAHVFKINGYSAAMGSAQIARDVLAGRQDFLGIGVDY